MSDFTKPSQFPALGERDCYADYNFPITECFKPAARQVGLLHYTAGEGDLYNSSGDLYCDQMINKAAFTVISSTKGGTQKQKRWAYDKEEGWMSGGQEMGQVAAFPRSPKPVDQDLYKISSHQLHSASKRKKIMLGLFSRCLEPTCQE